MAPIRSELLKIVRRSPVCWTILLLSSDVELNLEDLGGLCHVASRGVIDECVNDVGY